MESIDPLFFDWSTWRNGSIHDLGLACRERSITSDLGKSILREHTIGYCSGENLVCRPKVGETAIMCMKNGVAFWFHLRNHEFRKVFYEA